MTNKEVASYLIDALKEDFIVQKYNAYSTSSIYIKLDYGVGGSIRIGDHPGKKHLGYTFNVDMNSTQEDVLIQEGLPRYFYPPTEKGLRQLCVDAKTRKAERMEKYGAKKYKEYMAKNLEEGEASGHSFWKAAKKIEVKHAGA